MADEKQSGIDANIALQAQGVNPMKTLGSMVDVANGVQAFRNAQLANQRGQQDLQTGAIEQQGKQNMLNEYNGIKTLLSDPTPYLDQNGNIDMGKMAPDIMKAAPTTGANAIQGLSKMVSDGVAAKQAVSNLSDNSRASVGQYVMSLAGDDPNTAKAKLDDLGKLNPNLQNAIDFAWKYHLAPNANNPDAFKQSALKLGQSVMTPREQTSAITPSGYVVDTGSEKGLMNTNPLAGPTGIAPGTITQNTVAPAERQTIQKDPTGNDRVITRDLAGNIVATSPMPGAAPIGTPGGGYPTVTPGQPNEIEANRQEVATTRANADQAPNSANINQQILKLSRDTATGPGTEQWQKALGAASSLWGGMQNVNNYQELGKYLEKNAITNMQAMGGAPSDARLSAAMAANGSTQFNRGALQDVTKFNDATTSALQKYRQGMDAAVGLKGSDYTALPSFKAAWAKNMDVNAFRYENAIRDGDTMEVMKLDKELGKNGMKALAQKVLNLNTLSRTGRLPR